MAKDKDSELEKSSIGEDLPASIAAGMTDNVKAITNNTESLESIAKEIQKVIQLKRGDVISLSTGKLVGKKDINAPALPSFVNPTEQAPKLPTPAVSSPENKIEEVETEEVKDFSTIKSSKKKNNITISLDNQKEQTDISTEVVKNIEQTNKLLLKLVDNTSLSQKSIESTRKKPQLLLGPASIQPTAAPPRSMEELAKMSPEERKQLMVEKQQQQKQKRAENDALQSALGGMEQQSASPLLNKESQQSITDAVTSSQEWNKELDNASNNFAKIDNLQNSIVKIVGKNSKNAERIQSYYISQKETIASVANIGREAFVNDEKKQKILKRAIKDYKRFEASVAQINRDIVEGKITEEDRVARIKELNDEYDIALEELKRQGEVGQQMAEGLLKAKKAANEFSESITATYKAVNALKAGIDQVGSSGIPLMSELSQSVKSLKDNALSSRAAFTALGAAAGVLATKWFTGIGEIQAGIQADMESQQSLIDQTRDIAKSRFDTKFIDAKKNLEINKMLVESEYERAKAANEVTQLQTKGSAQYQKVLQGVTVEIQHAVAQFDAMSKTALFGESLPKNLGYSKDLLAAAGMSAEEVAANIKEAGKALGQMPAPETAVTMGLMSKRTGTSVESISQLVKSFQNLDGLSEKSAMNMTEGMRALAESAGIPLDNLMQEVANSSKSMLSYGIKNTKQLAKQVAAVQSIGVSFDTVAAAGKNMVLNYKDSIKAEMQLSSLLGEQVDLSEVRAQMQAGDYEGAMKSLQAQGLDIEEMDQFQLEALSQSLGGMDIDSITKMMKGEIKTPKDLKEVSAKQAGTEFAQAQMAQKQELSLSGAIIDAKNAQMEIKLDKEIQKQILNSEFYKNYQLNQQKLDEANIALAGSMERAWKAQDAYTKSIAESEKLGVKKSVMENLIPAAGGIIGAVGGNLLGAGVKGLYDKFTGKKGEPQASTKEAQAVQEGTSNALSKYEASPSIRVTVDKFKTEALKQLLGLQKGQVIAPTEKASDMLKTGVAKDILSNVPGGEAITGVVGGLGGPETSVESILSQQREKFDEALKSKFSFLGETPTDMGGVSEKLGIPTDTDQVMEQAEEKLDKVQSIGEKIKDVGKGIGSFIKDVGKGIGQAFAGIMQGISAGLRFFADPLVIAGAAGLAASIALIGAGIAGAAWIMGKALPTFAEGLLAFNKVDGMNLIKIGAGLTALGVGMAAMGVGAVYMGIGNLIGMLGSKGQLPIEQLQELSKVDLDAEKVKNNATAVAYYGLAMAALGTGAGLGGIGNAVGAVAGAITSLFGGPSMAEQFKGMQKFASYTIDAAKVKNNSEAIVAYSLAMSALGGGAAASGLGAAVGAVGDAIAGLFGSKFDINKHFQEMQKFASYNVDAAKIKNNSEAVVAYAKAMASLGGSSAATGLGAAAGAIGEAVARFFGGGTNVSKQMAEMQKFAAITVDKEKVKNNAEAFVTFGKAMSEYKGTGEGVWSKLASGLASFFSGGKTDLISQFERFSKINGANIKQTVEGINYFSKALPVFNEGLKKLDTTKINKFNNDLAKVKSDKAVEAAKGLNIIGTSINNYTYAAAKLAKIPDVSQLLKKTSDAFVTFSNTLAKFDLQRVENTGVIISSFASRVLTSLQNGLISNQIKGLTTTLFDFDKQIKNFSTQKLLEIGASIVKFSEDVQLAFGERILEAIKNLYNLGAEIYRFIPAVNALFSTTPQIRQIALSLDTIRFSLDQFNIEKINSLGSSIVMFGSNVKIGFSPEVSNSIDTVDYALNKLRTTTELINTSIIRELGNSFIQLGDNIKEAFGESLILPLKNIENLNSQLTNFVPIITQLSKNQKMMNIIAISFNKMAKSIKTFSAEKVKLVNDIPWARMITYASIGGDYPIAVVKEGGTAEMDAQARANEEKNSTTTIEQLKQINANTHALVKLTQAMEVIAAAQYQYTTSGGKERSISLKVDGKTLAVAVDKFNANDKGNASNARR